jgi:Cell Wall Hydrolase
MAVMLFERGDESRWTCRRTTAPRFRVLTWSTMAPWDKPVAWVIRNRADKPSWWGGPSIASVVLHPYQFSSFNHNDPNATKMPQPQDPSWIASLIAAYEAYTKSTNDISEGSVDYFDKSMDSNPPPWAIDGTLEHVCDL